MRTPSLRASGLGSFFAISSETRAAARSETVITAFLCLAGRVAAVVTGFVFTSMIFITEKIIICQQMSILLKNISSWPQTFCDETLMKNQYIISNAPFEAVSKLTHKGFLKYG